MEKVLKDANDKWNHYEQSGFFQFLECYDIDIKTIRLPSTEFKTTIKYKHKNVIEQVTGVDSTKKASKSMAILKFFEVNKELVDTVEEKHIIGDNFTGYYSFINRLNQDKNLQKGYKILKVIFSFNKISEQEFVCTLIAKDLLDNDKFIITKNGNSKRSAQNLTVEEFVKKITLRVDGEMDIPGSDETSISPILQTTPLVIDKQKETILTSDVPSASTLELTPIPRILQTASVSSIITQNVDLTSRWIQLDKIRIERDSGNHDYPYLFWSFPKFAIEKAMNSPNILMFKQYLLAQPTEMEIKFVFNSNKFNQGLLVASFLNDGVQMQVGDLTTSSSAWDSYCSIKQVLMRDHIKMDLNTSNEGVLNINYISSRNFVPIFDKSDEDSFSSALVTLHVLSPLKVPDEAQSFVDGTIYFRFKQVNFTALRPSSDIVIATGEGSFEEVEAEIEAERRTYIDAMVEREKNNQPTVSFEEWKIDPNYGLNDYEFVETDDEDEKQADGEIGPLMMLGLGSLIPAIAKPIGNTLGNIGSNILGGIANLISPIFGKMNPQRTIDQGEKRFNLNNQSLNLDKPAKIKQPNELRPNFVGDTSIAVFAEPKMSMRLDPTVLTPQFSCFYPNTTNQSVYELITNWNYYDKFTWSSSDQTVGAELYSTDINPRNFVNTCLGYFSHMYMYYSGTIDIMLYIVGTQFHTGAFDMSFIPFNNDFTAEQGRNSFYKLFYLRDERQVTFSIPFINTTVLRPIQSTNQNLGKFKIFNRNSLVPISTVTPSVEVLVFVKGGDDFHFSVLRDPLLTENIYADGEMDDGSKDVQENDTTFNLISHSGVACNIGEDHEIIPDIIKRYVKSYSFTNMSNAVIPLENPFINTTISSMIMDCYRFRRGSYSLLLTFKRTPTTLFKSSNATPYVDIITLDPTPDCPVNNLGAPPNLVAPGSPEVVTITSSTFDTSTNNWGIYDNIEAWRAIPDGGENIVRHPVNSSTTADVTNSEFVGIRSDLDNVSTVSLTNATTFNNQSTDLVNKLQNVKTNFDNIKSAFDTNVSLNAFNSSVSTNFNTLKNCVSTLRNSYNSNINNTNSNNVTLVDAINDSGGEIVAAETPVYIKIIYTPPNIDGIAFTGNPTQFITTGINPSIKINIPYYSMFNYQDWLCTSTKDLTKLSKSIGTLTIEADANVSMEGFWSAGDDFYVTKFIGIPSNSSTIFADGEGSYDTCNKDPMECYYADGEMEDSILDHLVIKPSVNFLTKSIDRGYVSFNKKVKENPLLNIGKTVTKYDLLADKADKLLTDIQETAKKVVDYIKGKFSWITCTSTLLSSIIHLLQAFLNPSKSGILLAISGIIINLGLLATDSVIKIFQLIKNCFKTQTLSPVQQTSGATRIADPECDHKCEMCDKFVNCHPNCKNCSEQRGIFDTDTCATLSGLVLASVSSVLGVKQHLKTSNLCSSLFKVIPTFWTSISHSIKFLKDFITLIKRAYNKILKNSEVNQVAYTIENSDDQIKEFIKEANLLTNQLNRNAIQIDPTYKRRFWLCVTTAYSLQSKFIVSNTPLSRNILMFCDRIIKLSNELAIQAVNCPVRYEPYVLAFIGDSGLGKSYMAQHLVPNLLKDVYNWKDYMPPIFTRTPGVEYWNNYIGQPCILYDDFLASTSPEIASRQIIEMYNLKSSAIMNCNMADIADKKMYANPYLVIPIMNKHIVPTGITAPEAFKRRKDGFWKVIKNTDKAHFTREEMKEFLHLKFQHIPNPCQDDIMSEPVPYTVFYASVLDSIKKYHEIEQNNVKFRFDKLKLTLPINAQNMLEDIDPCLVFYNSIMESSDTCPVQTGLTPFEVLQERCKLAEELQRNLQNESSNPGINGEIGFKDIIGLPKAIIEKLLKFPKNVRIAFENYIFGGERIDNLPAVRGECMGCLEEKPLMYHCINNINPHGCCEVCYRNARAASVLHRRCTICQTACIVNIGSYTLKSIDVLKFLGSGIMQSAQSLHQYLKQTRLYIPIVVGIISFLLQCVLSRVIAKSMCDQQEFIHDMFNMSFKGGIDEGKFFSTYNPNKYANSDDILEHPKVIFKTNDSGLGRTWNFLGKTLDGYTYTNSSKQGIKSYNHRFHDMTNDELMLFSEFNYDDGKELTRRDISQDDLDFYKEWSGKDFENTWFTDQPLYVNGRDIHNVEPEAENPDESYIDINIWWRTPKSILRASDNLCSHIQLLEKIDDTVYYDSGLNEEHVGEWHLGSGEVIYDATCGPECIYADIRKDCIKKFIRFKTAMISCTLRQLNNPNTIMRICPMPLDLVNPDYFSVRTDPLLRQIAEQINQQRNISFWDRLTENFGTLLKSLTIAVSAISFLYGLFNGCKVIYDCFFPNKQDIETVGELNPSGDFKSFKLNKGKPPKSIFKNGESNKEHVEMAVNKISRNSIIMNVVADVEVDGNIVRRNYAFRCLGIFNYTMILTRHEILTAFYLQEKNKKEGIYFKCTIRPFLEGGITDFDKGKEIILNYESLKLSDSDLAFYEIPQRLPQFKDITNLIASRTQHSALHRNVTFISVDKMSPYIVRTSANINGRVLRIITNPTDMHESIETRDAYASDFRGQGYCGSVSLIDSNSPIFSFHFSGEKATGEGYSIPLIREDFQKFKRGKAPYGYIEPELEDGKPGINPEGDFHLMGTVKKDKVPFQSSETKIIPSLIHGLIEDTPVLTQPAILSNKDPRYIEKGWDGSPLKWGIQKRCNPPIELPQNLINIAYDDVCEEILKYCHPSRSVIGKLDIIEAVTGFDGLDFYDRLKLNTSTGYPYNLNKGCTTKDNLIKIVEDEMGKVESVKIHKDLVDILDNNDKLRREGIRPITIFQNTLKDERKGERKLNKKDGTRVFEQSPVDYTIALRQYTLDFSASYMKYRHQLGHAVGCTQDGPEWKLIYDRLLQKGNNIISGDFTDFGPRIWCQLIKASGNIIKEWYKLHLTDKEDWNEFEIVLSVLIEEIATSYNICNNIIYQVFCGLPSGNALTVILNTICHKLLIRICWLGIMKEHSLSSLDNFRKYVVDIEYGDDGLISVHDNIKNYFNCETIAKYLKVFDFIFTDAEKTGNVKYTKISKATFLKRGFKKHPRLQYILAPLEMKSITETPQWIFKCSDHKLATLENCKQSLNLAYGHGPEFFDSWKIKLNEALSKIGLEPIVTTWDQLDRLFFEGQEFCHEEKFKIKFMEVEDDEEEILPLKLNVLKVSDEMKKQYLQIPSDIDFTYI